MDYYPLILDIILQFLLLLLLRHVANKRLLIDIPCLRYTFDTMLFVMDETKNTLIRISTTTAVSFNSSLNDTIKYTFNPFGINTIIIS